MKTTITILAIISLCSVLCPTSHAGELDAWEFNFFGINPKDFDGRQPMKMIGGAVLSLAAHEAGHLLASEVTGMGSGEMVCRNGFIVASAGDDYYNVSDDKRAFFSAAGFIVQSLGSLALTAIPTTRHSDWTVGWNGMTTVVGLQYALFGGGQDESSDTALMDKNGWPGREAAWATTLIGGVTTYVSLNKHK